jgi:hypothetical protein
MPSPLPGMDPYLEDDKHWPTFQPLLVRALYPLLLPGLMDRYSARVGERQYVSEKVPHQEAYIEVHQRSDDRLVTLMEVISPANKITAEGRRRYLDRRAELRTMNVNGVEIDLILGGQPLIEYAKDSTPRWDYAVVVTRWTHPDRYEIYSATLPKRLPRFACRWRRTTATPCSTCKPPWPALTIKAIS